MFIDTDVLIWYMKGNENARKVVEETPRFLISVVTYIELVQGMRNKSELSILRRTLRGWNVPIVYISERISAKAMFYVEQHYLSYSVRLADALIGATAEDYGAPLLTANVKHYRPLKGVTIKRFTP